jgi:hypothetical protein
MEPRRVLLRDINPVSKSRAWCHAVSAISISFLFALFAPFCGYSSLVAPCRLVSFELRSAFFFEAHSSFGGVGGGSGDCSG